MKKAAVATTTARGAAVNSSRITAVQSVYIAQTPNRGHHPSRRSLPAPTLPVSQVLAMTFPPAAIRPLLSRLFLPLRLASALALVGFGLAPVQAGVEFDNCQPAGDGGITCDTRPTGNTQMDDEAARYGLFNEASPGWSEFDPDQGFEDDFGGNET